MPKLGATIRQWRKDRGWSQVELAERSGLKQQSISDAERKNQAGRDVLVGLARAFGMTLDQLYQGLGLAPPLELAQAAGVSDSERDELISLWSYTTDLEKQLLLTTLRERARQQATQTNQRAGENQPPDTKVSREEAPPTDHRVSA